MFGSLFKRSLAPLGMTSTGGVLGQGEFCAALPRKTPLAPTKKRPLSFRSEARNLKVIGGPL